VSELLQWSLKFIKPGTQWYYCLFDGI